MRVMVWGGHGTIPPVRRAGLFSKCPADPSRRAKTHGRLQLRGCVRASRASVVRCSDFGASRGGALNHHACAVTVRVAVRGRGPPGPLVLKRVTIQSKGACHRGCPILPITKKGDRSCKKVFLYIDWQIVSPPKGRVPQRVSEFANHEEG